MEHETLRWQVHVLVEKWGADQVAWVRDRTGIPEPSADVFAACGVTPIEIVESPGNLLLTNGLNRLTSLLIGAGGQALTNTACRLGAGNSTTAEAVGQTDLQAAAGSANRWFQVMDASFPTQSNGVATFKSTFGTSDGNFVWNEWGVDVGTPTVTSGNTVNAVLFNRKVASLGTKASGSTWALTATVTIA